jgi:hypothetical protein
MANSSKEPRAAIEARRTSPVVIEVPRRAQDEPAFLRMAAIELRRIAEQDPSLAIELRHLAQKIDAEAEDLVQQQRRGG